MIYSGISSINGVGFIVHIDLASAIVQYSTHSDRIIFIKIRFSPVNLNIIQIYAPTDETLSSFYDSLQDVHDAMPTREMIVVMGDFNAKVGATAIQDNLYKGVLGRYDLGEKDTRGEQLVNFCMGNSLTIANTLFDHHPKSDIRGRIPTVSIEAKLIMFWLDQDGASQLKIQKHILVRLGP